MDNTLYACLVYLASFPSEDQLTISRQLINSKFEELSSYFPTCTYSALNYSLTPILNGTLFVKLISPKNITLFICDKKYVLNDTEEIIIYPKHPIIKIKSFKTIKISLSLLLNQESSIFIVDKDPTVQIQLQYLYSQANLELNKLFPDISSKTYPYLLNKFNAISHEPPNTILWILDQFCYRYDIDKHRVYLNLVLNSDTFLNCYVIRQLIIILNKLQLQTVQHEIEILTGKIKTILKRFDMIYPISSVESYDGCISGLLTLVQKIVPNYQDFIIECINDYIEFNYSIFKMNDEDDMVPSTSSTIAMLAQTVQNITEALINFGKYYDNEFNPYLDMLKVLSIKYYNKIKSDIKSIFNDDLILTEEIVQLHDNLYHLHLLITKCNLISPKYLINFKELFSPYLVKYLNNVRITLFEMVDVIISKDNFIPLNSDPPVYYSQSILDLFVFISTSADFIFKFNYDLTLHKYHLLYIIEDVLDKYIKMLLKEIPSKISKAEKYCGLYNILSTKFKVNKLISRWKIEDYQLDNLTKMIDEATNQLLEHFLTITDLAPIIVSLNDGEKLFSYLDEIINELILFHLPNDFIQKFLIGLYTKIINLIEDNIFLRKISLEEIQTFLHTNLDLLINLFHGEGNGVDKDLLIKYSSTLRSIVNSQTYSMLKLKLISPDPILKALDRLGYTKYHIILFYGKCKFKRHSGYLFYLNNYLDFISKNGKKRIHIDQPTWKIENRRMIVGNYTFKFEDRQSLYGIESNENMSNVL